MTVLLLIAYLLVAAAVTILPWHTYEAIMIPWATLAGVVFVLAMAWGLPFRGGHE